MKKSWHGVKYDLALIFATVTILVGSFGLAKMSMGQDYGLVTHVPISAPASEWQPYGERFAIVVMGGHVTGPPHYQWYWGDTGGMYNELLSYGFTADNIFFLSYGDSANIHQDWVDTVSTSACIVAAFQWAQAQCTPNDLLYIYWVDHGSTTGFETYDGTITHAELGTLIQAIDAKVVIGAYNPCYSGCVIDDVSAPGVITITSQDCYHPNSWGWAGKWRKALRGAPEDSIDTNEDGYISMTEAYNWIAPQSQAAGEHSMFDDNGDGVGHEWGQPGYDPDDSTQDGYNGKFYSLDGWVEYAEYEVTIEDDYSYPQYDDFDYSVGEGDIEFSHDNPALGDTVTITAHVHNNGLCRAGSAWGWYEPNGRSCWGEWDLNYTTADTVDISYRCRDNNATVEWRVELDGAHLVDVDVPAAATEESWKLVTIRDVPITSGPHTIFLGTYTLDGDPDPDYRLDWIEVGDVHIEAETYDRMGGYDPDPDLAGLGIYPMCANPPEGANLTVQIWDGNPSSGGTLLFEDCVGDTNEVHDTGNDYPEHTHWAHYIENNGQASIEVNWVPTDTGSHEIYVVVDPHEVLEEIDEINNVAQKSINVEPPTPHILSTLPTQNELNVSVNTNIEVTFDIDMDASTINESTFVVNARSTGLHQGSISFNHPAKRATFDPFNDFDIGEVVTVVLTTGIQSSEGIPLDNSYVWFFTITVTDGGLCFTADSVYPVGDEPRTVVAADVDNDGDLDLTTVNRISDDFSVLLNHGDATFAPHSDYPTRYQPWAHVAADFDGDGYIDLAAGCGYGAPNVSVVLNDGNGDFLPYSSYPVGFLPYSICVGDLDGDGNQDIATGNCYSHDVSVLLNQGNGTFAPHSIYSTSEDPRSIFAADVDADGDLDLITANADVDSVSILWNDGNGSFPMYTAYPAGDYPTSVVAADLDGDGDLDLATANSESHDVSVLLNNGDGTFAPPVLLPVGNSPNSIIVADLDGDGNLDLTTANLEYDSLSVILNNGDGTFASSWNYPVGDTPRSVFASDLDGDADLDLATANANSDDVTVLLNCLFSGDCTDDGIIDIGDVLCLINYLYKGGSAPDPLEVGDVNCDGEVDLGDVLYLISYLYKVGSPPCCMLCTSQSGLSVNCGGSNAHHSLQKTAGPAQVKLVSAGTSKDGKKLVEVVGNFEAEVGGVQFEFSYDPKEIQRIIPELTDRTKDLNLFFSDERGKLKIGMVDLTGKHLIPAGEGSLVRFSIVGSDVSSLAFEQAILVDENANHFQVTILPKEDAKATLPQDFALLQNYPNPFNPETEISYILPNACQVKLSIYNLLGQRIRTLVDEYQAAGHQTAHWDGTDEQGNRVASGIYFYRIQAGEFTDAKKMILMK